MIITAIGKKLRAALFILSVFCLALCGLGVVNARADDGYFYKQASANRTTAVFSHMNPSPAPEKEPAETHKITIAEKPVDPKYMDIALTGFRANVSGAPSVPQSGINEINKRLDGQYLSFLKRAAASGAHKAVFTVKAHVGEYSGITLYCDAETPTNTVRLAAATVFNENGEIITLADYIGADALKLINRDLAAKAAADPKGYNPAFKGVGDDHSFYVDGGGAVILFSEFEFSNAPGIVERPYAKKDFKTAVIERKDYDVSGVYAVKMIPLRQAADQLGLTLTWEPLALRIAVYGGKTSVTMTAGVNGYADSSGAKRALEAAPEIKEGRTFVPVSFFDEILGMAVRTENTDIVITAYIESNQ